MTVGLHAVNLANVWLNNLDTSFVKWHIGDPGAAGTANASLNTTRPALTWAAASGGSKAISVAASSGVWAAGAETITHISVWSASTAGNFLFSAALTTGKALTNGDTLNLNTLSIALTPIAA